MKNLFLAFMITGVIANLFNMVTHMIDGDLTGAMAWLCGVAICSISAAVTYALIREEAA